MKVIGIDGGGTSAKATLYDAATMASMATASAGSVSLTGSFYADVRRNLHLLLDQLPDDDIRAIGIGVAGLSKPGVKEEITQILQERHEHATIVVTGDDRVALRGAFGRDQGILLIAGTGAIAIGQSGRDSSESVEGSESVDDGFAGNGSASGSGSGAFYRVGGYGHILDDEGSAYAIGRDILISWVKQYDGRIQRSSLHNALEEVLTDNVPPLDQVMGLVYRTPFNKAKVAALSVLLDPSVQEGDPLAEQIAARAVEALSLLIRTLASRFTGRVPLVLAGGVLTHSQVIRDLLVAKLAEEEVPVTIVKPRADAMVGAADFALEAYYARHAR